MSYSFGPSNRTTSTSSSPSSSSSSQRAQKQQHRVVILIDLDSFYAQSECVRLGLDAAKVPLVLMQWSSALAVTYPARALGIERGDNWDTVAKKSDGTCLAVHVPVLRTRAASTAAAANASTVWTNARRTSEGDATTASTTTTINDDESSSSGVRECEVEGVEGIENGIEDYDALFKLTPEQQRWARVQDVGVRYKSDQGKTCIERYRIASARIFAAVQTFLGSQYLRNVNVTMERASIDEFFLDVSEACTDFLLREDEPKVLPEDWKQAIQETHVIGLEAEEQGPWQHPQRPDNNCTLALQYGCWLSFKLRQAVRTELGFTMSAGVACNKLLAKLSASFGKPNGQAVLYPPFVAWLLDHTPIRKTRNLGGKLGRHVIGLLPADTSATVGNLSRHLTLQMLTTSISPSMKLNTDTARWLLDYVKGIDPEPVRHERTTVKQISAFKTLNRNPILSECFSWFELLVREIVTRVERDAIARHRYPRFYHVSYQTHNPNQTTTATTTKKVWQQSSKGWKRPFPSDSMTTSTKIQDIVHGIIPTIAQKEKSKHVRLQIIGLTAVDFMDRPRGNARSRFFSSLPKILAESSSPPPPPPPLPAISNDDTCSAWEGGMTCNPDETHSNASKRQRLVNSVDVLGNQGRHEVESLEIPGHSSSAVGVTNDSDLAFAKRLQAEYDRENRMVEALERRGHSEVVRDIKMRRIDTFFKPASR